MDIKNIKMLISDVDGVWTDGSFYKGTDNIELKKFSVFDGVGVAMARAAKIRVALISGRYSPATEYRAKELNIEDVYNGSLNKIPVYEMFSGASIAIAALLLIVPGFFSDTIGFLLLIPFTRKILISFFVKKNKISTSQENTNTLDGEIIEDKDKKDEL